MELGPRAKPVENEGNECTGPGGWVDIFFGCEDGVEALFDGSHDREGRDLLGSYSKAQPQRLIVLLGR